MAGASKEENAALDALRACGVLAEASDPSIEWLAQQSSVRSYHKGDRILRRNGAPPEMGVVISGHMRAVHFGVDGRPVTVQMAWPCEPVGLLGGLAGEEYRTSFEAAEPNTSIVFFPVDAFKRLMRDEPDVMVSVIRELARQMIDVVTMIKTLAADVPSRVAIYIGLQLEAEEPVGNGPFEVDLGVSRVELAARLGTVPETLSRAFHTLHEEGLIDAEGHHVTVLDREALVARTNGVL
jgi:CRP/FNR family transcriptional regulator